MRSCGPRWRRSGTLVAPKSHPPLVTPPGGSGVPGLCFDLPGGGHALFTTRAQGNLSSVGGDGHEHGCQARERLCAQLGLRRLARGYQVHGTTVLRIRTDTDIPAHGSAARDPVIAQPPVKADGHATSVAGIGVMALAADCLPVALGSHGAVAMIHAGWRGLAAGVLEEGVLALGDLGGEGDIAAVIGPGAGPCCYEVGPEVHAAFASGNATLDPGAFVEARAGSPLDLKALARERLLAAGVDRVHDVGLCTICDERFFSYRRESTHAGRQAGIAWLE
jgi:polyphenol oxidase